MVDPPKFRLPPPFTIISHILSFSYGFTSDFTSWFFQHFLSRDVAEYFSFRVGGKWNYLMRLAQGWKFSPITAQTSSEILAYDEMDRIENLVWIDNIFMGGNTIHQAHLRKERFEKRCRDANAALGDMSEVTNKVVFVGGEFDLLHKKWRVKTTWVAKALSLLSITSFHMSVRRLWSIVGCLLWFLRMSLRPLTMIDPLIFFISRLAHKLASDQIHWDSNVELWKSVQDNISSLKQVIAENQWRCLSLFSSSLSEFPVERMVFSDASRWGGAGVWRGQVIWSGSWPQSWSQKDILFLEARAWELSICHLIEKGERDIVTIVDNQPLFYAIMKTRSKSFSTNHILHRTFQLLEKNQCSAYVGWVPSELMPADKASRGESENFSLPTRQQIIFSHFPFVAARNA